MLVSCALALVCSRILVCGLIDVCFGRMLGRGRILRVGGGREIEFEPVILPGFLCKGASVCEPAVRRIVTKMIRTGNIKVGLVCVDRSYSGGSYG